MSNALPGGVFDAHRFAPNSGPELPGLGQAQAGEKGFIPPARPRLTVDAAWAPYAGPKTLKLIANNAYGAHDFSAAKSGLETPVVLDKHARRPESGVLRTSLWMIPALGLHLGLIGLAALAVRDNVDKLAGAGGTLRNAINVDIVTSDVLESWAREDLTASNASAGSVAPMAASAPPAVTIESRDAAPPVASDVNKETVTDTKTEAEQINATPAPEVVTATTSSELQVVAPPAGHAHEPAPPQPEQKTLTEDVATPATAATTAPVSTAAAAVDARSADEKKADEAAAAAASAGIRDAYKALVGKTLSQARARTKFKPRKAVGTVKISFTISADGRTNSLGVQSSSGHSYLDDQALALVRDTVFPKPPAPVVETQQFTSTMTFK